MDLLARFPRVWCPTCNQTQPMIFDVMKANDKNDHDAACGAFSLRNRCISELEHGPTGTVSPSLVPHLQ
jgi:hypothetical protein